MLNMLNEDDLNFIQYTYSIFMEAEAEVWTEVDEQIDLLSFIDDDQLCREAEVTLNNGPHPDTNEPSQHLIVTNALAAILKLYKKTGVLEEKHKYILQKYVALSQVAKILWK